MRLSYAKRIHIWNFPLGDSEVTAHVDQELGRVLARVKLSCKKRTVRGPWVAQRKGPMVWEASRDGKTALGLRVRYKWLLGVVVGEGAGVDLSVASPEVWGSDLMEQWPPDCILSAGNSAPLFLFSFLTHFFLKNVIHWYNSRLSKVGERISELDCKSEKISRGRTERRKGDPIEE